jgi:hypothetical protein
VDYPIAAADETPAELRERFAGRGPALVFYRLALTEGQAIDHALLDADGKAEVDGLPVPVLDALLVEAIEALHDPAHREALPGKERAERERLPDALLAALGSFDA